MKTVAWCYDAGLPLAALARLGGGVGRALQEEGDVCADNARLQGAEEPLSSRARRFCVETFRALCRGGRAQRAKVRRTNTTRRSSWKKWSSANPNRHLQKPSIDW